MQWHVYEVFVIALPRYPCVDIQVQFKVQLLPIKSYMFRAKVSYISPFSNNFCHPIQTMREHLLKSLIGLMVGILSSNSIPLEWLVAQNVDGLNLYGLQKAHDFSSRKSPTAPFPTMKPVSPIAILSNFIPILYSILSCKFYRPPEAWLILGGTQIS